MKKSLFLFTLLLAIGLLTHKVSAQLTGNAVVIVNNTGCTLQVHALGADQNCNSFCKPIIVSVGPFSQVAVPFPCPPIPPVNSGYVTIVGIRDPATGAGVKVGNGCGLPQIGSYVDCQGASRNVNFVTPTAVVVH